MQAVIEPSRLCKDIFELEKDFKYNLFLLKVKDTEIERNKTQNEQLQHELRLKEKEHVEMHVKIRDQESALREASIQTTSMKVHYEETIAELSGRLAELKKTHESYQRDQQSAAKKREADFERICASISRTKEIEHQHEMTEMNDRLQKEMYSVQKIKSQLQEMVNENLSMRSQFQEKLSAYVSRISILESELSNVREDKLKLENELESTQKDRDNFETELKKGTAEMDQLKQDLSESLGKTENSRRNFNEISKERDNLSQRLKSTAAELQTCLLDLESTKEERSQWQLKFECLERKSMEEKCTITEHKNYENIVKQNGILQEVVKSMRKERSTENDSEEIERKIDKLEELVGRLKSSMLKNLAPNDVYND